MHEIRIHPDFKKLKDYFPDTTYEKVEHIRKHGLIIRLNNNDEENPYKQREKYQIDLDYTTENQFSAVCNGLKDGVNFKHYSYAQESLDEVLLLALLGNERLWYDYNLYYDFYEDDMKAKEIATFLLHCKNLKHAKLSQLVLKENIGTKNNPKTKSTGIKDAEISSWIYNLIYDAVASANFPLGALGERIFSHFKIDINGSTRDISIEDLEKTANISLKNPNIRIKNLMVCLCRDMLPFLKNYTILTSKANVKLTNDQANFFYDLLSVLGHIPVRKSGILDRDYMHTLFKNY
ncbi:hypothetical protein QFZ20_000146 [Flavobacterium sp. W4I14]|nr:hypothetical protein [Flavobacterium sp. W4I14]